ncbi:hypothetical protein PVK06_020902 [Gossypium arboreum]|uniref:Uncharacterized protein n=1 Tax=Gossypium arboreum TaxID=29729 RepID=A0ABR0PNY7_GOSAR|nr:hypothetical protein PVK06_020902 [Gossypium arboreum]
MTTTHSADFDSAELNGSTFLGDQVVTSFPRHDVVKLDEASFIQSSDGGLVVNPAVLVFDQQDSLLTSWLLSTISPSFLSSFTDVKTAHDVWLMANSLFAADSSTKQSQLRHELHSLRKASGSYISEAKRSVVLLAGLSSDFDSIVSSASLSSSPFPFQRLVDALIECKSCQAWSIQEVLVAANTVEGSSLPSIDNSLRGGDMQSFWALAQHCYYRYHRDEPSPVDTSAPRRGGFVPGTNGRDDERMKDMGLGQNWGIAGQNWRPHPWPNYAGATWAPRKTHVGAKTYGFNPFVPRGDGLPTNVDQPIYDNRHAVGPNQNAMGINHGDTSLGHSSGQVAPRSRGPIKAHPHDGTFVPEPSANCVGNASWCPDSGATHHVCRNDSNLHGSTPYSGHPDTGNLTVGPSS